MGNGYIALIAAPFKAVFRILFFPRWLEEGQTSLFAERTNPEAQIRSKCYLKESFFEEPGVAQIMDGTLSIFTVVTQKAIHIPLDQVRLTRFRRNNIFGRYPWWKKTCFGLETPSTKGLVLGFSSSDAKPWIEAFKAEQNPSSQGGE
jgi:hypothetical protein